MRTKCVRYVATSSYEDQRFVFINHVLALHYTPDTEKWHYQHADNELIAFLSWLCKEIPKEILKIRNGSTEYNRFLEKYLPYEKRTGKILRSTFWQIMGDETIRLDKELPSDVVDDLEMFLELEQEYDTTPGIPEISASGFLRLCEICYQSNNYFRNEPIPLSPIEQ